MITGEHTLQKYDVELEQIRSRVLQMGGLVESQFKLAMEAFESADLGKAEAAVESDRRVNELQLELDRMVNHLIARRQPTAGDLRMITGIARAITDIERIGDEATKIARAVKWLHEKGAATRMHKVPDVQYSGEIAVSMLRRTLDAFARMDANAAMSIIKDDQGVDDRFRAILRQLITFMMEDPRTISTSLDVVWAAKAIERIGDHAKNIAEHIVFIAQGVDMRHMTPEEMERALARG